MTSGILTGCNEEQEWMLKSWWKYYSKHNSYPVTFIDFGMSFSAKIWCEKRGDILAITPPKDKIVPKERIDPALQKIWENVYSENVWKARPHWFAKPQALLKTPYEKTIWIDLDTFVLKPLTPLFDASEKKGFAIALEVERSLEKRRKASIILPEEIIYNTGVVSYKKKCPIIEVWAEKCLSLSHKFMGDQEVLSRMIHEENIPVETLSSHFNRRVLDGLTDETTIVHFANTGKRSLYIYSKN